jgi:ubiquinone/menaquinone biosynthesis C-methylase UbiE
MTRDRPTSGFDGVAGRITAPVMARMNRDMELAAVAELAPSPDHHILAVGFGPGIGIEALVPLLTTGTVTGIDPSVAMVDSARHRSRRAIEAGRVTIHRAGAEDIPGADGAFDAVIAVNSVQLWHPLDATIAEVARVIRPGGSLVTVTHVWAIEKSAPLPDWIRTISALLAGHGLSPGRIDTETFRSGRGLILRATAS